MKKLSSDQKNPIHKSCRMRQAPDKSLQIVDTNPVSSEMTLNNHKGYHRFTPVILFLDAHQVQVRESRVTTNIYDSHISDKHRHCIVHARSNEPDKRSEARPENTKHAEVGSVDTK